MIINNREAVLFALLVFSTGAAMYIDYNTVLGYASGVLYVFCVIVLTEIHRKKLLRNCVIGYVVLILLPLVQLLDFPEIPWHAVVNRFYSVVIVVTCAYYMNKHR